MTDENAKDPMHGVTLKAIVEDLVARHGWPGLAARIRINCFSHDPSVSSSLRFLRKTDWARTKVENLYRSDQRLIARNAKRNRRRKELRARGVEPDARADGGAPPDEV